MARAPVKDISDVQPLSDIRALCKRARLHIEEGAITPGYAADRETVI